MLPTPAPVDRDVRSNVPIALSSFIADHTRSPPRQLLTVQNPRTRLPTLVGPGGIGKTRLGPEVARSLIEATGMERFPDGVRLADLSEGAGRTWRLERYELEQVLPAAPVGGATDVDRAVAEALSARSSGSRQGAAARAALAACRMLSVEHAATAESGTGRIWRAGECP